MIGVTLLVAFVGIALVARAHPLRALGLLIASMYLYPEYLRVPMGLAEMSAPRFIALVLLARLLAGDARRKFRWRWIDSLVLAEWAWTVLANILAGAEFHRVSEMIGRVFDTALIYFVVRLCLSASREYGRLLLPLAATAIVIGTVGVLEAVTSHSPYQWMQAYQAWTWFDKDSEYRFGLLRAQGSMSHSIYFGVAVFLLLGLLVALRGYSQNKTLWRTGVAAAFLGALSSMSSGPQQAIFLFLVTSGFYLRPKLIKPALIALSAAAMLMEVLSNRHFWYLTEYINFFGGDYWYRARLIDVAAERWSEYWLIGLGSNVPNHWGLLIDGRTHVDIVNHYIIIAISGGLLGLGLFVGEATLGLRQVVRRWRSPDLRERQLAFGLGATCVSLLVVIISVGLYSVPLLMTYALFGFMATDAASQRRRKLIRKRRIRQQPAPTPLEAEALAC